MKRLSKLLIIFFILVYTSACSNNNFFSDDELQKLVSSVEYDNINKVEFDKSKNKLNIFVNDEFINELDVNNIIKNIKIKEKYGLDSFDISNFENKKFDISLISVNNNEVLISNDNVSDYKLNILVTDYSDTYIENKLSILSKNLVLFNDLTGRIEIDLKKNQINQNRIDEFSKNYTSLNININELESILKINFEENKNLIDKIYQVKNITSIVKKDIEKAIATNNHFLIEKNYLNVNELDK
ncbi:hypothetical protein, partial [Gemelliphila palaticanis]